MVAIYQRTDEDIKRITRSDSYPHIQDTPSAEWIIQHDLNRYPNVKIIIAGELVEADILPDNINRIRIRFAKPEAGEAYLD